MVMIKTSTNESGFTLIELLIAMVILGVVLTGVVRMFSGTNQYNNAQEMLVTLNQDLRAVKQLMVDEIRSARCNPKFSTGIGFKDNANDKLNTDRNSIHFTRDIDNTDGDQFLEPDGEVDGPNEDIVYYRRDAAGNVMTNPDNTAGTLVRVVGGGTPQPLMDNVVALQFIYYNFDHISRGCSRADIENPPIPPHPLLGCNPAELQTPPSLDNIVVVEVILKGRVARPAIVNPDAREQEVDFRIRVRNP